MDKEYLEWVKDVVARYRQSQIKAAVKVNQELLAFYWSLGKDIVDLKAESKWGEKFYKTLSADLCAKLPDVHSFSETSLKYIKYFYSTYSQLIAFRPQLEDELKTKLFSIPWGHQRVLLDKFKDNPEKALFFVQKVQEQNWSRATGYDEEEYRKISQMKIPSPKFEYRCNLVYNGLSWDIVKDGAVVKEFEVNGPKNSIIVIQCFFRNPETGAPRVVNKEIQLSQGAQIIDLIFN